MAFSSSSANLNPKMSIFCFSLSWWLDLGMTATFLRHVNFIARLALPAWKSHLCVAQRRSTCEGVAPCFFARPLIVPSSNSVVIPFAFFENSDGSSRND